MYGDITFRVTEQMRKPEVADYFAKLIQRTSPKSYAQAYGEVFVTTKFLENFCGDQVRIHGRWHICRGLCKPLDNTRAFECVQVRFLAKGFTISGDHTGQTSTGVRWPYGPVCLITPFNFPLEIPVLQLMGALYMGNKPLLHVDHRVSVVVEQFVRLLIDCGMPATDVDLLHGPGSTMGHILEKADPRSTLFTGESRLSDSVLDHCCSAPDQPRAHASHCSANSSANSRSFPARIAALTHHTQMQAASASRRCSQ